jgi:hypothetical protein
VQQLRSDSTHAVEAFLLSSAARSPLFAYHLLCALKVGAPATHSSASWNAEEPVHGSKRVPQWWAGDLGRALRVACVRAGLADRQIVGFVRWQGAGKASGHLRHSDAPDYVACIARGSALWTNAECAVYTIPVSAVVYHPLVCAICIALPSDGLFRFNFYGVHLPEGSPGSAVSVCLRSTLAVLFASPLVADLR